MIRSCFGGSYDSSSVMLSNSVAVTGSERTIMMVLYDEAGRATSLRQITWTVPICYL